MSFLNIQPKDGNWKKQFEKRRRMRKLIFIGIAIIAIAIIIGPFLGIGSPSYSEGNRVGTITKFSHKGLIFKSYEGEMNLGGFKSKTDEDGGSSVVANVFEFSVRDPKIVEQLDSAMTVGKRVELQYSEHLWAPYDLHTSYIITGVKILK